MKISILSLFVVFAFSCKNNQTVETTDAQDVLEQTEASISYVVNTGASQIEWEGSKPTGTHTGFIKLAEGKLSLDQSNTIESGEFVLDLTSITVTDLEGDYKASLEGHLKGTAEKGVTDFFDITNFPNGSFAVTGVRVADGKSFLQGNLTLKETTKNIEFPVNLSLDGDKLILQSEKFTIDRTQWNINYGSKNIFKDLGDKFINDDVSLVIYLEANKI